MSPRVLVMYNPNDNFFTVAVGGKWLREITEVHLGKAGCSIRDASGKELLGSEDGQFIDAEQVSKARADVADFLGGETAGEKDETRNGVIGQVSEYFGA